MESFLIKAAQLIAALAFLVVMHELGHYIFARIFGIKVEKFYLFFNPGFSLVKWKPKEKAKKSDGRATWRDTEYGIGWLPLGGYVKIAGMIDESMDKEQMAKPPQPWEFRAKPAYQRLLVMLGGVLFNFILAILIYAGIAIYWGDKYVPLDKVTEGFDYVPTAQQYGFRNGDIPLSADGKPLDAADQQVVLKLAEAHEVKVLRNHADTVTIKLPDDFVLKLNNDRGLLAPRVPVYVDRLVAGGPAAVAGIREGDHIIGVGDKATPSFTELTPALRSRAGRDTDIRVIRSNDTLTLKATPDEYGKLGFQLRSPVDIYETVTVKYNLLSGFPRGWEIGTETLGAYVGSLKHLFSSEGAQSIGGFGAMGSMFPDTWNWYAFWQITAFFSVALAIMNLLPIPALDGGHVLFLLYEVIARRKAPEKVMEIAQYIGMCFLLCLLLYANGMDLFRALFK